ncbi:unnamed protein product [Caenorhabditis bovis]|uniref:G-protein coupled receptors family 1 profile domain-containing protein n=1 Tax=Caenorhabditis bovis TaxID=2654633 RepID=A0A8S1EI59_9PELO|nr:unnamed protein product [Caenorhabditis bovis]
MGSKWYCFLFWFCYRFTLACLAHFNWCLSIYTNCAYFTMWKSYDLLWFWMHLILCSCFPQLRPENYLIVWTNLIIKKCTRYPDYTFKQLYYALYTTSRSAHFTKRLMSRKEKKGVIELDSDSDEEEAKNEPEIARRGNSRKDLERSEIQMRKVEAIPEIEERETVVKFEEPEDQDDDEEANENTPLRPPRRPKTKTAEQEDDETIEIVVEDQDKESPTTSDSKWKSFIPNQVIKFLPRQISSTPSIGSKISEGANSTFSKVTSLFKNRRNSTESEPGNEIEVLRPDYSNKYDIHDESKRLAREKRDRKALRARIRYELRMQLKLDAANERKRKKVTDAIELLLQLLRMMASFAMLIGTIRKTFIPAQFKYLRPGQHAYDNYELIILFRCTAFLDIAMFWMNVSYAYCLQWQLCCRLGCIRFLMWATILGILSVGVMLVPMTYAMDELDLSWCRFRPNTTLAQYQPSW